MSTVIDEKELRKAWLKRKFGSWEYHEELLKLHDEFLTLLHRHWANPEIQKQYPSFYQTMQSPVFLNFDKVQKPGEIPKNTWKAGKQSGWANTILYNFSRGLSDIGPPFDICAGMDQAQLDQISKPGSKIQKYAQNITYTVEHRWDEDDDDKYWILDEEYTGPINWPPNWRDEIVRELGDNNSAPSITRCEANRPCPYAGYWWTPAKENSRRYFKQGEIMPDFPGSSYGATIWQWDVNQ